MYNYPLHFKTGETPADEPLTVTDAKKTELIFRPKLNEAMVDGKAPIVFFADKLMNKTLYYCSHEIAGKEESDVIKTPDGTLMGTLLCESKHNWKVLDKNSNASGKYPGKERFQKHPAIRNPQTGGNE